MAPTPVRHPLRHADADARRRAIAAHPAGRARQRAAALAAPRAVVALAPSTDPVDAAVTAPTPTAPIVAATPSTAPTPTAPTGEEGSMTTEYGLVVVVGATICSLVIKWASGGAVFELLGGVLDAAKGLVGF